MTNGLAANFVVDLHEDGDGILWIATAKGSNRLKIDECRATLTETKSQQQFFTFTTAHGLLDNLINRILEDEDGFLWFSCNRGIFRMRRSELNAIAEGAEIEAGCAVFGTEDGMLSSETNGEHQPAGCKGRDGRLWFPTTMGVVAIDPKTIPTIEVPPKVVIEQLRVDDRTVFQNRSSDAKKATSNRAGSVRSLPARARVIQVQFTANSFVAPEKIRFKYRLQGHDRNWREVDSKQRVAYTRTFHPVVSVRGQGLQCAWFLDPAAASIGFEIPPTFTQTMWFPAMCVGGLLGISGMIAAGRLRWQRRVLRAEQLANLERERARIARDLHDDLGSALTGLALNNVAGGKNGSDANNGLNRLAAGSRALVDRLREVVWAINPSCDNADNVADFFAQFAERLLRQASAADLKFRSRSMVLTSALKRDINCSPHLKRRCTTWLSMRPQRKWKSALIRSIATCSLRFATMERESLAT